MRQQGATKSNSFADRWLRRQHECGQDDLGPPKFLNCGNAQLPSEAAPFLTFEKAKKRPHLWEIFGAKASWSAEDKNRLAGYRMIGSDGCGNPLCVEDPTGVVWMLDHEDNFRTRQYVNSSVALLAECLLVYMGEEEPSRLLAAVQKLDHPASAKETFWDEVAANLKSLGNAE